MKLRASASKPKWMHLTVRSEGHVQQDRCAALARPRRLLVGNPTLQIELADEAPSVRLEAEMDAFDRQIGRPCAAGPVRRFGAPAPPPRRKPHAPDRACR